MKLYTNRYLKITSLALALLLGTTGCKKLIEIDPKDQIDSSAALVTKEGINATITSIYAALKTNTMYGQQLNLMGDALSDNATFTNRSGRYAAAAVNQRGAHYAFWSLAYSNLNRINLVLEALPAANGPGIDASTKTNWEGQLKFLRALYHFELARAYAYIPGAVVSAQDRGGIPLLTKAVSTVDQALVVTTPRAPLTEVYAFITADLNEAIAKLGNLSASNTASKATKQGAQALLSRVSLYNKDWATVVSASSDVIAVQGATLSTAANYFANFTAAKNPETLFEVTFFQPSESLGVNESVQTNATGLSTRAGAGLRDRSDVYAGYVGPAKGIAGFGDAVPTLELLSLFGLNVTNNANPNILITRTGTDVRGDMFEVGASNRSPAVVETTKWLGKTGTINVDNIPVIRIAEMYLNRAEAYANAGPQQNLALALADVNTIRTNRGLTALVGLTQAQIITEIFLQRRLEFAFEGQRFFDLKRTGQDINKPTTSTTIAFTDLRILPQIPSGDVTGSNGAIQQNFGY